MQESDYYLDAGCRVKNARSLRSNVPVAKTSESEGGTSDLRAMQSHVDLLFVHSLRTSGTSKMNRGTLQGLLNHI